LVVGTKVCRHLSVAGLIVKLSKTAYLGLLGKLFVVHVSETQKQSLSPIGVGAVLLTIVCWLMPGLFGREPWKPDEAYTFGVVWQMFRSGDWLVPQLAGEPFMEKPPFFFWTAVLFVKAFGSNFGPVGAARLANILYVSITMACITAAGRLGQRRWILLAFVGTVGLLPVIHLLFTDLALMTGMSLGLLGLIRSRKNVWWSGLALGSGAGLAFMSKGFIGPGILVITALSLPMLSAAWRRIRYGRVLGLALLASLPWFVIWPLGLYVQHPDLFTTWIWDNNFGRFFGLNNLGPQATLKDYFASIGLFCFPTLPLALSNIRQEMRQYGRLQPDTLVALLVCVTGLVILAASAQFRDVYLMPIIPALAVLAGRRRNDPMVCRLTLAVIAAILSVEIIGWVALVQDWPSTYLDRFISARRVAPPDTRISAFNLFNIVFVGLFFSGLVWMSRQSRSVLIPWSGGIAIIWFAFIGLYLPWLASGNNYEGLMRELDKRVATIEHNCLASQSLGEPQRAMLDFYDRLRTERLEKGVGQSCNLLLTQAKSPQVILRDGWNEVWRGSRPGDTKEFLILWQRALTH
jgi:hypothetical protein